MIVFLFSEDLGHKSRLHGWHDVAEGDIKKNLAHLMGLVCKGSIPKYWDHGETLKTAFFGTYMGQNTFQSIMSNLQVLDSTLDLPNSHPLHDKLFKVRPFLDIMDKNFQQSYKCGRDFSFDEGCCRLKFKCYNPRKPNK